VRKIAQGSVLAVAVFAIASTNTQAERVGEDPKQGTTPVADQPAAPPMSAPTESIRSGSTGSSARMGSAPPEDREGRSPKRASESSNSKQYDREKEPSKSPKSDRD
jgi:hypothetical protein